VEELAGDLAAYHLFHAIRGELLVELGRLEHVQVAERRQPYENWLISEMCCICYKSQASPSFINT
jgi:hypothetical protein